MSDSIKREDAIKVVHEYFIEALYKEPTKIDEDGDKVFADMRSVNKLLTHNKNISKALKELPSAEDVSREDYHNLLTALDDVDRALRQYQAKDENQSTDDNWMEKVFQEKLGIETANEILSSEEELGNWIERMLWHVEHIDHDNWIPVKKHGTPQNEGIYIVTIRNWYGAGRCAFYDDIEILPYGREGWDKATAWMPLPKPYREGDEV